MKKTNKMIIALSLSIVLLMGCLIGGTLAWLLDKTNPVRNVFTTSDIDIELDETTEGYEMVPGHTIDKDPFVTVKANSEACYVFVKVEKTANLDTYIAYAIDGDWKKLEDGVYYLTADELTTDQVFHILGEGSYTDPMGTEDTADDVTIEWENDEVGVKPSVTRTMMDDIKQGKVAAPELTFTAYSVQRFETNGEEFSAAEAWALAQNNANY
ncbi:MAG: hypothetical protein E7332_01915 [Clostridiales bacterium]|nr:hypothetical protein [Clostridiales bacterium]